MVREFCEMVRSKRLETYTSARDFILKNPIGCTYAYYAKVEKDTVPELDIALRIIDKLKLNTRKALYAWMRDQLPTSEYKSFFAELDDKPLLSSEQKSVDRSLVVNRMQSRLLMKNPLYWELIVYISSYFKRTESSLKQIAQDFGMKIPQIEELLTDLFEFGLLDKNAKGNFVSKEWIFIPYEPEFQALRETNFKQAFEQFGKTSEDSKFRTTVTGLMKPVHLKEVEAKILALTNFVVDMTANEMSPDAVPYTVGVFASKRRFGT